MVQHLLHQGPVVGETVDPGQAAFEQTPLHPAAVAGKQMRQKAIVAINPLTPEGQGDILAKHQLAQRLLGFISH